MRRRISRDGKKIKSSSIRTSSPFKRSGYLEKEFVCRSIDNAINQIYDEQQNFDLDWSTIQDIVKNTWIRLG